MGSVRTWVTSLIRRGYALRYGHLNPVQAWTKTSSPSRTDEPGCQRPETRPRASIFRQHGFGPLGKASRPRLARYRYYCYKVSARPLEPGLPSCDGVFGGHDGRIRAAFNRRGC